MQRWPKRDFGQKHEEARDTCEETATLPLQMAEQLLGSGILQLHQSASAYEHQRGSSAHSIKQLGIHFASGAVAICPGAGESLRSALPMRSVAVGIDGKHADAGQPMVAGQLAGDAVAVVTIGVVKEEEHTLMPVVAQPMVLSTAIDKQEIGGPLAGQIAAEGPYLVVQTLPLGGCESLAAAHGTQKHHIDSIIAQRRLGIFQIMMGK